MGIQGEKGTDESDSVLNLHVQEEMNSWNWVILQANPNPKARNGTPLICLFPEHYLLPPPISSWRGPINASITALQRDVLASFCLWELNGIAAYLDCLFSLLLNIHMNTCEVFFCPLPSMKDSKSHLVLIFLPRKNSFILARILLFINWLREKHKHLWNVDNGHLHSGGNSPLSEISMQENGSCRQNKGDLSQNSAIPFTSPETKRGHCS